MYPAIVSNVFDTGYTESGYGLLLDGESGIYFALTPTSSRRIEYLSSGANTLELDKWHHIAGAYDGQQMKVYVDGVETVTKEVSSDGIHYNPENDLLIGAYRDNDETYPFKGTIDDVRIWKRARSQAEIQADMNRQLTGNEEGLVGYWRLNEGKGDAVRDQTDNGNDGAIHGATWVASARQSG